MKKMYIVKREVIATSVVDAARRPGTIYEISIADEKFQPPAPTKKRTGFKKKK